MSDPTKPLILSAIALMALYLIGTITTIIAIFALIMTYLFTSSSGLTPVIIPSTTQEVSAIYPTLMSNSLNVTQAEQIKTWTSTSTLISSSEVMVPSTPTPLTVISPSTIEPTFTTPNPLPTYTSLPHTQTPTSILPIVETPVTTIHPEPTRESDATTPSDSPSVGIIKTTTADLKSIVEKLANDGVIQSANGKSYKIPDFEDSWNKTDYNRWNYIDPSPADFVLRSNVSWNTTAVGGMAANSGCGFIFRENGPENYYLLYLGLNGRVYFYKMEEGKMKYIGKSPNYPIEAPQGSAELMLIVDKSKLLLFVDGDNLYDTKDDTFKNGKLGLTAVSGSAQSFGTKCKMENIELWAFE
jgi:hypothetical protein